jgi:hypothetical protein
LAINKTPVHCLDSCKGMAAAPPPFGGGRKWLCQCTTTCRHAVFHLATWVLCTCSHPGWGCAGRQCSTMHSGKHTLRHDSCRAETAQLPYCVLAGQSCFFQCIAGKPVRWCEGAGWRPCPARSRQPVLHVKLGPVQCRRAVGARCSAARCRGCGALRQAILWGFTPARCLVISSPSQCKRTLECQS